MEQILLDRILPFNLVMAWRARPRHPRGSSVKGNEAHQHRKQRRPLPSPCPLGKHDSEGLPGCGFRFIPKSRPRFSARTAWAPSRSMFQVPCPTMETEAFPRVRNFTTVSLHEAASGRP